MGEKAIAHLAVVGVLFRRFFFGWYAVEKKIDCLEEENRDIKERLVRIENETSRLLFLEERRLKNEQGGA